MGKSKRSELNTSVKVPGPGAYNPKIKSSSPGVGIRGRLVHEKSANGFVPGPGRYNPSVKAVEAPITHTITFVGRPKQADTEKQKLSPGPGNYNVASNGLKHGPVFGTSKRSGPQESPELKKMPGPGAYNAADAMAKIMSAPKYGFGSANRSTKERGMAAPGPGAYAVREKFGNEGRRFTLSGRPKSAGKTRTVPGPDAYSPKIDNKSKGFKFGSSNRKEEAKSKVRGSCTIPGPGQYDSGDKYRAVLRASPSWKYVR